MKGRMMYGPTLPVSIDLDKEKYCLPGESFDDKIVRISNALKDNASHFDSFRDVIRNQRFLPGGRVQSSVGAPRVVTAFNCFVSGNIEDSMASIMQRATEAAETMRRGGGIGYDFSKLRPRGDLIVTLGSRASGPISFMGIFDAICHTIASAGHRRGAQMGVLRVDHPDIQEFIRCKNNSTKLTGFNISIGITDKFMECLESGEPFPLVYEGRTYAHINAQGLWDEIMRSTWDYAEPGVLFIDRINEYNNLWYCESIAATNPCGEQPLPPYGACLLGSFNLVKYLNAGKFDFDKFNADIPIVVRAMDNIIDRTVYPLEEQKKEALNKRRMGLGVTGLANAIEACGHKYGSEGFLKLEAKILKALRDGCYSASADLAAEKGSFPLYDKDKYLHGKFIKQLPTEIKDKIRENGIRNSHLLSIAPTGTISLTADNVSSGIEPPYTLYTERTIQTFDGPRFERIEDYGMSRLGVKGVTATEASAEDHLNVLLVATKYVDSAVSKTCNVSPDMPWEEFKQIYYKAWKGGAKGITTFNPGGKRYGILQEVKDEGATACYIDPSTGKKTCE